MPQDSRISMVGPSAAAVDEVLREEMAGILPMPVVKVEEGLAALDDRMALPQGLGPMAGELPMLLLPPVPGPTLR